MMPEKRKLLKVHVRRNPCARGRAFHKGAGIETAVVELTEYKENIFDCTVNNARNIVSAPSL